MPLYEYQCEKCGNTFEVLQKFSDTPIEVHADCGGKVVRLISAPGLQFKGSGWYITDYARSGGGGKGSDKGGEKSGEGGDKGSSKTESKPAETKASSDSKPATTSGKKD